MAVSVVTNVSSLGAQRNLTATQGRLSDSIAKLSSGLRINKAADDASGSSISSQLSADIRGMDQASRSANDAVSMMQTAEGALKEVDGLLMRMRELATQASTAGTIGSAERSYLDQEFESLKSEINRITAVTEFNGQVLVDGTLSTGVAFQVGFQNSANARVTVTFDDSDATALSINASDISTASNAQDAIAQLDTAISSLAGNRADVGAAQNRLNVTISNLASMSENLQAANSRIKDVDVASETALLTRDQILLQAGVSVLAQANQTPSIALSLLG